MDSRKILVTGAAGAIGIEVIKELIEAPGISEIRTLDLPGRKTHRALKPYADRIRIITGSVEDSGTVEKAVAGVDMVIHLAAVIPPLADSDPDLAGRVNIWGTHNVIQAIKRLVPDAFLLFSSSVAVYGDRLKEPWISVDDPLTPSRGDLYGNSKVTAEELVRNSGLRFSIFRFTGIMNPSAVTSGKPDPLMFHMPLDTSLEIATTRDCGFALSHSIYHMARLEGRTFNLAGGSACRIRYGELLERTFDILGMNFGRLNKKAFATCNFHCGYFTDSDELEEILHFQRDSVESYLKWVIQELPRWRRILIALAKNRAIHSMLSKSDPLNALKSGNDLLIRQFFGITVDLVPGP